MRVTAEEFSTMRAWFALFAERVWPDLSSLPPEVHPVRVLDGMVARTPGRAREGLALAISDILEDTSHLPLNEVAALDAGFLAIGLPTLTTMRLRFAREVTRVVKRGSIRNEAEYYAVRNVVDHVGEDRRDALWALLAAFEEKVRPSPC